MSESLGRAVLDLATDDSMLRKGLKDAEDQTEKSSASMGSKMHKGLKKALVPSVAILGAIGLKAKETIDAASDLNEQVNKSSVVFGKSGGAIEEWSKTTAKSIGVSQRAALEAAGVFGNMLVPMGFAKDSAAKMSKSMVQLSADMASFNNADPSEVMEAMRAGLSGEAEPLRRFGVFLSQARVEAFAMSKGIVKANVDTTKLKDTQAKAEMALTAYNKAVKEHGKDSEEATKARIAFHTAEDAVAKAMKGTKVELTSAQKAQATYGLIMQDTKAAQGDFARTSTGVANAQRIQKAETEDLNAKLGSGLLPIYSSLQQMLLSVTGFLSNHTDAVKIATFVVGGLAATVVIANGAIKAYEVATKLWTAATWLANAAQKAMNATLAINPYVAIAVATIAIAVLIITHWRQVRDFIHGAWQAIKGGLETAWNAIKSTATSVFGFLKNLFLNFTPQGQIIQHWNDIKNLLLGIWDKISDGARDFVNTVKDLVVKAFVGVVNTVIDFVNDIIGVINKIPGVEIKKIPKISGPANIGSRKDNNPLAAPGAGKGHQSAYMGGLITSPRYLVGEEAPQHPEVVLATNPRYRGRNLQLFHMAGRMLGVPGFAQGGFVSSAYGPPWGGIQGGGTTATGVDLHSNPHILGVAVDPSVIPLGTKLRIQPNPFGTNDPFTAFDTGGAIKGNRIDFYDWLGRAHQNAWGMRNVSVSKVGGGGGILGFLGHALGSLGGLAGGLLSKGAGFLLNMLPGVGSLPDWLKGAGKWALGKAGSWIKNKVGGILGFGGGGVGKGMAGSIQDAIKFASGFGFGMPSLSQLTGGQHAPGSYHYMGRAADFGFAGHSMAQMRSLFFALVSRYGSNIKELFFDPIGWYIKNGSKVSGSIGGHGDHIHLALRRGGLMNGAAGGMGGLPFVGSFGGGGVVPLPTGHPGLAIVHGQERIGMGADKLVNVEKMVVTDSGDAQRVARSLAWNLTT